MRITGFSLKTQLIPICRLSMGLCRKATSRCPSSWGLLNKDGATRRELSLDLQVLHLLRDIDEQRSKTLGDIVKTDATWNMLAELLRSRITRRRISVTSLCLASRGPVTSALRRLDQLLADGLVTYNLDPQDRRRKYIELTAEGANRVQAVVRGVAQRWAAAPTPRKS